MSDVKFSCPSCGQHIQCDESHTGENIPCPDCAHLVRVPATASIVTKPPITSTQTSSAIGDESKVSYAPTDLSAEKVPTLDENFSNLNGNSATNAPLTEREKELAAARAEHPPQVIPPVKPRLSFILSGGEAPIPQENEAALRPGIPPADIKTVNE